MKGQKINTRAIALAARVERVLETVADDDFITIQIDATDEFGTLQGRSKISELDGLYLRGRNG